MIDTVVKDFHNGWQVMPDLHPATTTHRRMIAANVSFQGARFKLRHYPFFWTVSHFKEKHSRWLLPMPKADRTGTAPAPNRVTTERPP
jgi:hypothetical protein